MRKCEGVSRPFASDTSPKRIDREGLGKRRTGTRQGIYKSSIKADPNGIIFSRGVFGTSWKVVDATAKFLKSIKLTTQARAISTGCLEFTNIFKVCWSNIFSWQFKNLCWFACYPTELQLYRNSRWRQRSLLFHSLHIWITKTMSPV